MATKTDVRRVRKVFDTKSTDLFWFDPEEIRVPTTGALADARAGLPVLESLVLDIMVRGVVEPVIVAKGDDGMPELIDGRQRVRAATEANRRLAAQGVKLLLVPAVYRRADELGMFAAMICANEHRQQDAPIERARKAQRFLDLGASEDECAVAFGVSRPTIRNWLSLLDLGPAARSAMEDGKISPTAASQIAKLPKEKQAEALVRTLSSDSKPTVRKAREQARATDGQVPTSGPARPRMRSKLEIEQVLANRAAELRAMDGITVCRWVLGGLECEELRIHSACAPATA
jgi:ParB family chromosome partitioning protein